MADIQDSTEVIHRIDQDTRGDNSVRFEKLVRLLEHGTDEELNLHLEGFTIRTSPMHLDCWIVL